MPSGHASETGHAEVAGGRAVEPGKLGLSAAEADWETGDFSAPAFAFGLLDAADEVAADFDQAWPLGGAGRSIEHRTQACSWMQALP
ncbi:hypothetical protein [Streptomyces incanus]|uniref:hypothetical protein n=1 Tax=Streptomyces incanus TaxID=887453 RepID=UPI0036D3845F